MLTKKLATAGLHPDRIGFLASWLADRTSQVVLGGAASLAEVLADVFQGTVLGTHLWNVYFADARRALVHTCFQETVFANDLNVWRAFRLVLGAAKPHEAPLLTLREAQSALHRWSAANQVIFDPGKASFDILHRIRCYGETFKILGCVFDPQLRMFTAARHIAMAAGWRLKTVSRNSWCFTTPELVRLYKAQILPYLESSTPALHHAAACVLAWVDRVQLRFQCEIWLSELEALKQFRLAPLKSRRDMAMLGILHKVNLGTAPPQLQALVPKLGNTDEVPMKQILCDWRPLRSKQFATHASFTSSNVLKRSLFGLVHCDNRLRQHPVDTSSVQRFQRKLRHGLLQHAELGASDWQALYSTGWRKLLGRKLKAGRTVSLVIPQQNCA